MQNLTDIGKSICHALSLSKWLLLTVFQFSIMTLMNLRKNIRIRSIISNTSYLIMPHTFRLPFYADMSSHTQLPAYTRNIHMCNLGYSLINSVDDKFCYILKVKQETQIFRLKFTSRYVRIPLCMMEVKPWPTQNQQ